MKWILTIEQTESILPRDKGENNVSISLEKISTCRALGLNWTGGGIADRTIGSKLTFKAVKEKLSKLACEVSSGGK